VDRGIGHVYKDNRIIRGASDKIQFRPGRVRASLCTFSPSPIPIRSETAYDHDLLETSPEIGNRRTRRSVEGAFLLPEGRWRRFYKGAGWETAVTLDDKP
jgi:hypothetical protein